MGYSRWERLSGAHGRLRLANGRRMWRDDPKRTDAQDDAASSNDVSGRMRAGRREGLRNSTFFARRTAALELPPATWRRCDVCACEPCCVKRTARAREGPARCATSSIGRALELRRVSASPVGSEEGGDGARRCIEVNTPHGARSCSTERRASRVLHRAQAMNSSWSGRRTHGYTPPGWPSTSTSNTATYTLPGKIATRYRARATPTPRRIGGGSSSAIPSAISTSPETRTISARSGIPGGRC
jgi:hypothetical protein